MILLKSLKLNNFISHDKTEIVFKPEQHLLLDGLSGSGKSSIVEAIGWALYGQGRSNNKALIKRGKRMAKVILELYDNETYTKYKIERSITDKNRHEFSIFEKSTTTEEKYKPIKATGVRGNQEYLETKILHSSYLLFVNSILYMQENVESFVKQSSGKRKDILLEIIGAGDYDEYLQKAKDKITSIKANIQSNQREIEIRQQEIENSQERANKLLEYQRQQQEVRERKDAKDKELKKINEEKNSLLIEYSKLENKRERASEISNTLQLNSTKKDELIKKINELEKLDLKLLKDKVKELNDYKAELEKLKEQQRKLMIWQKQMNKIITTDLPITHDYDKEIEELNKQLIEVMEEDVEKCPNCGTPCPNMEKRRQERISILDYNINNKHQEKRVYEERRKAYNQKIIALGEEPKVDIDTIQKLEYDIKIREPYREQLIEAESNKSIIGEYQRELELVEGQLLKNKSELATIEEELKNEDILKKKIVDANETLRDIEQQLNTIIRDLEEIQSKLNGAEIAKQTINKNKEKIMEHKKEYKKLNEDMDVLNIIKDAFSVNGVRAIVIDILLPQLEDKINAILSGLSDFRIKLETQKGGMGKDVVLEGLFISVINTDGEESDYETFSGGEKIKITLAIFEGLATTQRCNFRIMDESIVGLDEQSIQGFTEAMIKIQQHVNQLICISHLSSIKNLFEDRIKIIKINGTSAINK